MANFIYVFLQRSCLSLLSCLAISVLFPACEDDDTGPGSDSVENISPVANNGEMSATVNGIAFNPDLIGAALGKDTENEELDAFYIIGAMFNNGDTTAVSILFTGVFDDVVENTNYSTSSDFSSQTVNGLYLNVKQSATIKEVGSGLATIRFSKLDRGNKVVSGSFSFSGFLANINGQMLGNMSVSGTFTEVTYQDFDL